MSSAEFEVKQEDELLMHSYATLPKECKKYWHKRYKLFSKFDEGVYMTSELWYSVTPEETARFIAEMVKQLIPECENVLDVCCGGGGNTIQFAKYFTRSVGIDVSVNNIKCCEHNSHVYEVGNKTTYVLGDWNELSETRDWIPKEMGEKNFDFIFSSPPWGGPSYKYQDKFDLNSMKPFNLRKLCVTFRKYSENFGLFLPRNSDFDQIREITKELYGPEYKTRINCIWQDGRPVAIFAIFGPTYTTELKV